MARKIGCGSSLAILGFLAVLYLGMHYVAGRVDRWRFPWGYADTGQPTLVGTWVGPFTSGSGRRHAMLLEMELVPLDRGRRRPPLIRTHRSRWLEGRVLVCSGTGGVRRLNASGEPEDGSARRFRLATHPMDSVSPEGLAPSHIRGQWDGGDSLALEASLYLRRGKSAISGGDNPDTSGETSITVRRGTEAEFNALCAKLAPQRR